MIRLRTATGLTAIAALAAGCASGGGDYANKPRPASPINITAAITDKRIAVSPAEFGAGPVVLIIANQTDAEQRVTLETDDLGESAAGCQGKRQTTSPINPDGTATMKIDLCQASYEVSVASASIRPAELTVGSPRESAQNELLQP